MVCDKPTCHKPACELAKKKKKRMVKRYRRKPRRSTAACKRGKRSAMHYAWVRARKMGRKKVNGADVKHGWSVCGRRRS